MLVSEEMQVYVVCTPTVFFIIFLVYVTSQGKVEVLYRLSTILH